MVVGDCQAAFGEAARRDGIELVRCSVPWLNQRGHFGLPAQAGTAMAPLQRIFEALNGDVADQQTKNLTALAGDFIHAPTGTLIEVDEFQHFTTARLRTLRLYPDDVLVGNDHENFIALCERHRLKADRYRAKKPARGFPGEGGRQRQRAYYDALRDLAAPAMGHPPVVRIPVFDDDGHAAYLANRHHIRPLLGD